MKEKLRIGLLIDFLISEYCEFIIEGVKECCKKVDIDFYIFQVGALNNRDISYDYQCVAITAFLSEKNIDGLIFLSTTQTHHLGLDGFISYINSYYPIPIVNISDEIPGIPSVYVNYENAFRNLVEHVVKDVGAKNIALMSAKSQSEEIMNRERIFWQVIQENHIPINSIKVWKASLSYSSAMYELNKSDSENENFFYDAIICLNDDMAMACMDYAKERGIRVPEDLVITGFDNLRKAIFYNPALSTVDQMVFQQGYVAARTLYDIMVGKKVPLVQTIDAKAILRKSTKGHKFFNKIKNNNYMEIDRASLADIIPNFMPYEWYQKRTQLFRTAKLYMDMESDLTPEQIVNHMTYSFHSLGIPYVVIVAYDNPVEMASTFDYFHLPHKAKIISYFDKKKNLFLNYFTTEVVFDPNEYMLPEEFMPKIQNPVVAMALYSGKYQLGYMLIEKTNFDIAVFETLRSAISVMVATINNTKNNGLSEKEIQEKVAVLDKIAHTDELTGILNRRGLFDFGQKTLDLSQAMMQKGLLIYCDMDGLKKINDNFGHESGDRAIIAEAGILKSCFRTTDIVARISGDEFVVISPGMQLDFFEKIKEKVNDRCIKWTEETNSLFLLSISLGAIEYPHDGNYDLQTLMSHADSVMYMEKRRKKCGRD